MKGLRSGRFCNRSRFGSRFGSRWRVESAHALEEAPKSRCIDEADDPVDFVAPSVVEDDRRDSEHAELLQKKVVLWAGLGHVPLQHGKSL